MAISLVLLKQLQPYVQELSDDTYRLPMSPKRLVGGKNASQALNGIDNVIHEDHEHVFS